MKNIKLTLLGTAALLIAVALNVRHALNDYGIKDNKLHVEVLAQSNGSGGGDSTDGGNSTDGSNSNGGGSNFMWNGKEWNTTDTHNWGKNWLPVLTTCQVSYGIPPYVIKIDGHKVTCNYGNGNCLQASPCRNA